MQLHPLGETEACSEPAQRQQRTQPNTVGEKISGSQSVVDFRSVQFPSAAIAIDGNQLKTNLQAQSASFKVRESF